MQENEPRVVKARAETSSAERVDELNDLKDQKAVERKGCPTRGHLTLERKEGVLHTRRAPGPTRQGSVLQ